MITYYFLDPPFFKNKICHSFDWWRTDLLSTVELQLKKLQKRGPTFFRLLYCNFFDCNLLVRIVSLFVIIDTKVTIRFISFICKTLLQEIKLNISIHHFVHITLVRWLASWDVNGKYYSPPSGRRDKTARQAFNLRLFFGTLREIR